MTEDANPDTGTRTFAWRLRGADVDVAYDVEGDGPPVLLLPSLGPVCTRAEMWSVARSLARRRRTFCVDWPGFGIASRPLGWRRDDLRAFLADLCEHLFDTPVPVVATGLGAAYVLQVAETRRGAWSRIALVAPAWRATLPTSLGGARAWSALLRRLLGLPGIGHAVHRACLAEAVLTQRYAHRMFGNAWSVTPRLVEEKGRLARLPGARRATAALLSGSLDPVRDAAEALDLVDRMLVPLLAVCGTETPRREWRDMLALSQRPGVDTVRVPGALAPHEEHPAPVARAVDDFMGD